jgi:hypothetical protein
MNENAGVANMVGQGLTGMATGASNYLSAQEEAKALQALREDKIAMASNGPLIINPNSPNRAEFEALAKKHNIGSISFGVNTSTPNLTSPSVAQSYTMAQSLAAPKVMAPQAPKPGLLRA